MFGRRYIKQEAPIQEQFPPLRGYSRKKQDKRQESSLSVVVPRTSEVQGVNSSVGLYSICQSGAGQQLCKMNFSQLPGQKKRLFSIVGASTFLVNYAQDEYPSKIEILVNQIGGYLDLQGNPTHVVAVLVPDGPATPVYNGGGVIGYNVAYKLIDQANPFDISNLPQLTFTISTGQNRTPAIYPIAEPLVITAQVTRVVF